MEVRTQGLQVYVLAPKKDDPSTNEVFRVGCVTSVEMGEDSRETITKECLDALQVEELPGRITLGDATLGIYPDSDNKSSIRLYDLYKSERRIAVAIGWSDGVGIPPEIDEFGTGFSLSKTRTWNTFDAVITGYPFSFPGGSLIASSIPMQRKTDTKWIPKTEEAPPIKTLESDQKSLEMKVGDKKTLTLTAAPLGASNGALLDSTDNAVATVSASGEIVAKSAGKTTIKATSTTNDLVVASCSVVVTEE